ncbi:ATPase [Luteipulveratus mongoliensis]|uniref:ATPase n=1 Tax=Luteipulveratus mongoliensis TaxID=571913 RepID=A0A0K1JQU7_9MICO|nr:ATPase [Luteipulveratus mongoliensis]
MTPDPVHAPPSNAATFGRVADDGTVLVRTPDGEREVGSYPGSTPEEALAYFARKYDELAASATLLLQRVTQTDLSTHDGYESLKGLRSQIGEAHVVGDLAQLDATVEQIATALKAKSQVEGEARAVAKQAALAKREAVVSEAEQIAQQPVEKVQWKQSTTRMRQLLDEWKALQRSEARLDKEHENGLWQRFSTARNGFDKTRRSHFAKLDEQHSHAKGEKERLVVEAERLATSKDWGPTASAFKRLMGEWRQAGRAARNDDDALWQRFKTAQDSFFHAKDEIVAAENVEFEANLKVKEQLLTQAQGLLPVKDLAAAKSGLRSIQEKWDAAGKVPRKDMERIERAMRKVEQTVRDAEDARWTKTDPEHAARAKSMVDQLEAAVADLKADLAKAGAGGDARKIKSAQEALDARQAWLDQARGGLEEFGG